jgi:hypothetical protein
MKSTRTLRFPLQRLFLLTLVSFVAVAALLGVAASANKSSRTGKSRAGQAANTKSAINPSVENDKQGPAAPSAAVIVATLTDNVTAATKIAPGGMINYTATITNNGAASPADDATNLNYSGPLDANTTLVANSVHASPIAFNDTYNWVGNTQLDTAARALPAVTANDVAVNAPTGTDTLTLTGIAGGPTALGGTVTLVAGTGAFTYTPPLGRPNLADGATVQDSFTYTITNNVDPTLTSVGTVRINLTGRVWYLQAGAAGDGRSNTPSSSPAAMSTAADKSTDFFYIFSNAASLNGPFSVDAGQQLLGQGVNLVVSAITLFNSAAPTPTTTNTAGSCVALAGAPGNNTLSGFNIGNCTGGTAITGANVGTLNVSTMTINTNGGALDLTGVGAPTVSVVLGSTNSTAGARNVNLIGLNGTVTLAGGALSGATGNSLHMDGGNAGLTFSGTISNSGARQVNIINKNGGTVALSGAISGTGTGIFMSANNGATMNFTGGIALSTGTNDAFTATGPGPAATSGGTVNITQNNTTIVNTLTATTGSGLNITNTTIGSSGATFRSISSNGGSNDGIILNNTGTTAGLTISANGGTCTSAATCTGGAIQNKTGADSSTTQGTGVFLSNTSGVVLDRMQFNDFQNHGIKGTSVTGFSLTNSNFTGTSGTSAAGGNREGHIHFDNLLTSGAFPTATIDGCTLGGTSFSDNLRVFNTSGTLNRLIVNNTTFGAISIGGNDSLVTAAFNNGTVMNVTVTNCTLTNAIGSVTRFNSSNNSTLDVVFRQNKLSNNNPNISSGGGLLSLQTDSVSTPVVTFDISCNRWRDSVGHAILVAKNGGAGTIQGSIVNNVVGLTGSVALSGSTQASGIKIYNSGTSTFNVLIANNDIRRTNETGIFLQNNNGSSTLNASVFANVIAEPGNFTFAGVNVDSGALAGDTNVSNVVIGSVGNAAQKNDVSNGDPFNASDVNLSRIGGGSVNISRNGSASGTVAAVIDDNNLNPATTNTLTSGTITLVNTLPTLPPAVAACGLPPSPNPIDDLGRNRVDAVPVSNPSASAVAQANTESATPSVTAPLVQITSKDNIATVLAKATPKVSAAELARIYRDERPISHHAVSRTLSQDPNAPTAGENVTLNTIATFPAAGKSITIKYSAMVNQTTALTARQASTQGTVTANGGAISVLTDDPEPAGAANPTVTLLDTTMTWTGVTSTDWNTATNWTTPGPVVAQTAPGVSNPAVNDVVIPNVGNQPIISATDIGIYSLNISNGRTLTITSPRVLTIGGSPGGDLTLDGIISGGNLNLGTGTHVINNAGGTGSLSSANVATVLSGSTVTLNNNLQAGALAVNAGGSMIITNRTLSLNGSGPALVVPGGATFTTTTSTVIFNGTAAQQAAGIAYNNLTINNTIGAHVTGVTLTGNATVNGVLTLTSSDLATGAFTLTMPAAATSGPASGATDVVGNVRRTGFVSGGSALSFGNPFNTIRINSGAAPADINILIAKNSPVTYAAAVKRSYTITPNGAAGPATLRLHYRQAELNGNVELPAIDFNLRKGPTWSGAVIPTSRNTGVPEDNWLENNNVTSFSEWTFATLSPTDAPGTVTGRIVDGNGNPVEGAVVRLTGTQNRKFITDANGVYRFDNVETGGFYTVTPSRANFEFSPSLRAFNQLGQETSAIFTANATGQTANPLDTPEYFVRQHYVDFFGREPDESGFNFWSDQITECGGDAICNQHRRENVSAAFYLSIEFRKTGLLVDGLYRASYGTRPNFEEFIPDARTVGFGVQVGVQGWETKLQQNKEAFAAAFVNRPAFHARYDSLDASTFVDALVSNTGVNYTAAERNEWISGLGTGNMSRADVVMSIAENERFVNAKFNDSFVMMQYFGYLRRNPDPNGFAFWLNKLNEFNGNFEQAEMVKAFIVSGEFRDRFPR